MKQIHSVSRTYIGTEKRLDPHFFYIRFSLFPAFIRIIKRSCIAFHNAAVFIRKLSCITDSRILLFQTLYQICNQIFICRNRILCHKDNNIRIGMFHATHSGTAMIKHFFADMIQRILTWKSTKTLFDRILFHSFFPQFFFCV